MAVLSAGPAWCAVRGGFGLGVRQLQDEMYWDLIENHFVWNLSLDYARKGWPVRLDFGLTDSEDSKGLGTAAHIRLVGDIREASVGVLKLWTPGDAVGLHIGAGASHVRTSVALHSDVGTVRDSDTDYALYGRAGITFNLNHPWQVRFDLRMLTDTNAELYGLRGDADYLQATLDLGLNFD